MAHILMTEPLSPLRSACRKSQVKIGYKPGGMVHTDPTGGLDPSEVLEESSQCHSRALKTQAGEEVSLGFFFCFFLNNGKVKPYGFLILRQTCPDLICVLTGPNGHISKGSRLEGNLKTGSELKLALTNNKSGGRQDRHFGCWPRDSFSAKKLNSCFWTGIRWVGVNTGKCKTSPFLQMLVLGWLSQDCPRPSHEYPYIGSPTQAMQLLLAWQEGPVFTRWYATSAFLYN